jgi:hypothetical protein
MDDSRSIQEFYDRGEARIRFKLASDLSPVLWFSRCGTVTNLPGLTRLGSIDVARASTSHRDARASRIATGNDMSTFLHLRYNRLYNETWNKCQTHIGHVVTEHWKIQEMFCAENDFSEHARISFQKDLNLYGLWVFYSELYELPARAMTTFGIYKAGHLPCGWTLSPEEHWPLGANTYW